MAGCAKKPFKNLANIDILVSERSRERSKLKRIVGFHLKNVYFVKVTKFNILALAGRSVKDQKARFADVPHDIS